MPTYSVPYPPGPITDAKKNAALGKELQVSPLNGLHIIDIKPDDANSQWVVTY